MSPEVEEMAKRLTRDLTFRLGFISVVAVGVAVVLMRLL